MRTRSRLKSKEMGLKEMQYRSWEAFACSGGGVPPYALPEFKLSTGVLPVGIGLTRRRRRHPTGRYRPAGVSTPRLYAQTFVCAG